MSKTITAVFGNGIFATTAKVFQWDAGDKLQFVGIDLPEHYKVDFSNSLVGASKSMLGDSTGVVIPPEYFHPGRMIYAWVVIPDNDGRYTKYQVNIPIYMRATPTNEEPTPEQESALDEAITALNDAAENIPEQIDTALQEARESGELGVTIYTFVANSSDFEDPFAGQISILDGPLAAEVVAEVFNHDDRIYYAVVDFPLYGLKLRLPIVSAKTGGGRTVTFGNYVSSSQYIMLQNDGEEDWVCTISDVASLINDIITFGGSNT